MHTFYAATYQRLIETDHRTHQTAVAFGAMHDLYLVSCYSKTLRMRAETNRGCPGLRLCRPRPRPVEVALDAPPVTAASVLNPTGAVEADSLPEAEGEAGPSDEAGALDPGALATSVASPDWTDEPLPDSTGEAPVGAGAASPVGDAAGDSAAADDVPLEAAGTVLPALEKSTTAGPGQVNFWVSLLLTL
jgi:hypothetical protein